MKISALFLTTPCLLFSLASTIAQAEVFSHNDRYDAYMQSLRVLPTGMNQHEFKVYLLDAYIDVYSFYRDLPSSSQQEVFDYYSSLESVEISELDSRIQELL